MEIKLPTFVEFCNTLAEVMTSSLIGEDVVFALGEKEKLALDLQKELRSAYEDTGSPYGKSEEDMVRYLLENTQIEIEGEES